MKNIISIRNIAFCLMLLGTFLFQACDDDAFDVEGNPNNIVYIHPVTESFDMTLTPVGFFGDEIAAGFGIKSTQPMKEAVTVTAVIDNSLVEAYNTEHETAYKTCPASLQKATATISEGAYSSSDSINVVLPEENYSEIDEVGKYLVPVRLSSVTSGTISTEYNVVYLEVVTTYSNCVDQSTSVAGTEADRTGWAAFADGEDLETRLFDNSGRTYCYRTSLPLTIEIDLGSVQNNITGFSMDFYGEYYSIGSADIYTSETTTDDYELQGTPAYPASVATQNVSFYETVSARYIKIVINSDYSNRGIAMTEFHLFQQ